LITIPVKLYLPVNSNIQGLSDITGNLIQVKEIAAVPIHNITFQDILTVVYFIVSAILLVRFAINIYSIIRLIRTSQIVRDLNTKLVLIDKKTLPYSFFKYIFINSSDYKKGIIEKELIIHEQAHCLQYHTIDILLIELIKIILWFNPLLWLFRKAIQLNHEYIADNEVLSNHGLNDYQNTLLNLVFRNNSTYLASSFNYSLTKKRLIMMTKNNSLNKAIYRKIAAITVFLMLALTLTFSQEPKQIGNAMDFENEWWYPILVKHSKVPSGFNNFRNIFEMGENNSINDGVCTLTNAYVIIRDSIDNYLIIESPLLYHDFNRELLITNSGTMKMYKKDSLVPYTVIEITKMELHALKN